MLEKSALLTPDCSRKFRDGRKDSLINLYLGIKALKEERIIFNSQYIIEN